MVDIKIKHFDKAILMFLGVSSHSTQKKIGNIKFLLQFELSKFPTG